MDAGKGAATKRPLSPHLQVYRPQITSVLSILHRITGVALAFGIVPLVYWLAALAGGPDAYAAAYGTLSSGLGQLLLFGWVFCFSYHLLNGVRHLFWDAGWGFEIRQVNATGLAVVGGSALLTLLLWVAIGGGS